MMRASSPATTVSVTRVSRGGTPRETRRAPCVGGPCTFVAFPRPFASGKMRCLNRCTPTSTPKVWNSYSPSGTTHLRLSRRPSRRPSRSTTRTQRPWASPIRSRSGRRIGPMPSRSRVCPLPVKPPSGSTTSSMSRRLSWMISGTWIRNSRNSRTSWIPRISMNSSITHRVCTSIRWSLCTKTYQLSSSPRRPPTCQSGVCPGGGHGSSPRP